MQGRGERMADWGRIASLEAEKRYYMDCPHGASSQGYCVFCLTNTEPTKDDGLSPSARRAMEDVGNYSTAGDAYEM